MAVISKGITLSYKNSTVSDFKVLTDLQEIPELGGDVDKIEITTLADAAHMYTNGIKNYGDSVAFKFLYAQAQFNELSAIDEECEWKVTIADGVAGAAGTTCTFSGTPSVKLDGVGVNAALTYSLNVAPSSEMVWA